MDSSFQLAGGSMPGKDHLFDGNLLIGKNNHDAYAINQVSGLTVAVVADGCGSHVHSEVGAKIGAGLLSASLLKQWQRHCALAQTKGFAVALPLVLEAARQDLLSHLRVLAQAMTVDSFSQVIYDYFLFTLVGALITDSGSAFFSIGDGLIVVNGSELHLGPFPGNEPPYLSYGLLSTRWKDEELRFTVHRVLETRELATFLIGSDGAGDLSRSAELTLPGSKDKIGPLSNFWTADGFFSKTGIRKRLALIQSRYCGIKNGEFISELPRLKDDTTFVVGRRVSHTAAGKSGTASLSGAVQAPADETVGAG